MNQILQPGTRSGCVSAPASKSHAHRLLICAGLGSRPVAVTCGQLSKDIEATAACMTALTGPVTVSDSGELLVTPCPRDPSVPAVLRCGESGSTLRFLIPVCGALGRMGEFHMEGRLPERPLAPLDSVLRSHGMTLERDGSILRTGGKLQPGRYEIAGNVSSQYISGLLFALPLLDGGSTLEATGALESSGYISMTESALRQAGIRFTRTGNCWEIPGRQRYYFPAEAVTEGDCSNAAFFLCMGALSSRGITVENVPADTLQGDRAILTVLRRFGAEVREQGNTVFVRKAELKGCTVDAAEIPDLVPVIAVTAAAAEGETNIIHAERLRIKESDRLETTAALLRNVGAEVEITSDGLRIRGGKPLTGGTVDACNDHRIAMSAAVAACISSGPVTVVGAQCINKSFPTFFERFDRLEIEL